MTTHLKPGDDVADILPFRFDASSDDKEPRVVGLDGEETSEVLSAISSETARTVLSSLHEEPATPSEVADRVDTSIQNAQYHLGRLEDAGLIEPGGTAYSEKGREMTVYAPADRALVVVAGKEEDTNGLRSVLSRLLGGLGVVALGSVVVDRLTRTAAGPTVSLAGEAEEGGGAPSGTNATGATAADATPTEAGGGEFEIAEAPSTTAGGEATSAETATRAAEATRAAGTHAAETTRTALETAAAPGADTPGVAALSTLAPAELFFLGGIVTLACATAYWWVSR